MADHENDADEGNHRNHSTNSSSAQMSEDWVSPISTMSDEEIQQSNTEFIDILQHMQTQASAAGLPREPPPPPPPPPPSFLGSIRRRSDDSDESGSGGAPSLKRARVACLPCRKAKQRCDNGRPCGRCVTRHKEQQCVDGDFHHLDDSQSEPSQQQQQQQEQLNNDVSSHIRTFKAFRPRIPPSVEIGECIQRTISQTISVQEIHDMIVNKPLKWMGFLGFVTRFTSESICQSLRAKLTSEAICVSSQQSVSALLEMNPMKEIHFVEVEFKKISSIQEMISDDQIRQKICQVFNVPSLDDGVSLVKLAFLPHKMGPSCAKATYMWNEAMETLLECDYKTFFDFCQEQWEQINARAKFITACPSFWRMFTSESFKNIVKFNVWAYFGHSFEHEVVMDVQAKSGVTTKCFVYWRASFFPLVELPESVTIAVRPVRDSVTVQ